MSSQTRKKPAKSKKTAARRDPAQLGGQIAAVAVTIAALVALLVFLPRTVRGTDRSIAPVEGTVVTLPPEGVDTFVFGATQAPAVEAAPTEVPIEATVEPMEPASFDEPANDEPANDEPANDTPAAEAFSSESANIETGVPQDIEPVDDTSAVAVAEEAFEEAEAAEETASATDEALTDGQATVEAPGLTTLDAESELSGAALLDAGGFEYLPVINDVDTDKKWIAITVDDCFQVDNLQKILKCAYKYKAKLTIFPIGENLGLSGMKKTLKKAVELGFEIENHTWSHARVFRMSEEEMAAEIWKQDQALNKLLGVTYQEHFFRCMGGDGEMDQRTHNYLKQLGYRGVAHWSYSGSDASLKESQQHLHPGAVYLFHTTPRDTKILMKFIPWVAKKGYKMVTLNKLVGFEENKTSKLKSETMPDPQPYTPDYRTIKKGEYSYMTVLIQDKLRSLGYLKIDGPSSGYYGDDTAKAVTAFQQANGMVATGEADKNTQIAIFGAA